MEFHNMHNDRMKNGCVFLVYMIYCAMLYGCHAKNVTNPHEPDQVKALESYKKQRHRFEIRACKLFYNGQQLLFDDTLFKYENIFGRNYIKGAGDLYFKDTPISLSISWANLNDRQQGKPGADKDTLHVVNSIQIWLSLPDDIDNPSSQVFRKDFLRQQKMLDGFMMLDSVLFDVQTDVDFINRELIKKIGFANIRSKYGDHKFLGYTFYYPDMSTCTPIADESITSSTYITIIREDSNNLREVRYNYAVDDQFPEEEVTRQLRYTDSLTHGIFHLEELDSLGRLLRKK